MAYIVRILDRNTQERSYLGKTQAIEADPSVAGALSLQEATQWAQDLKTILITRQGPGGYGVLYWDLTPITFDSALMDYQANPNRNIPQ